MMQALELLRLAKKHFSVRETTLSSAKIKPLALVVIELRLSEDMTD